MYTEITEDKLYDIWSILYQVKQVEAKTKGDYFSYFCHPLALGSLRFDPNFEKLTKNIKLFITPIDYDRFDEENAEEIEYKTLNEALLSEKINPKKNWSNIGFDININELRKGFYSLLNLFKQNWLKIDKIKLKSYEFQIHELKRIIFKEIDSGSPKNHITIDCQQGKIEGCSFLTLLYSFEMDGFVEIGSIEIMEKNYYRIFLAIEENDKNPLNRTQLEEQIARMNYVDAKNHATEELKKQENNKVNDEVLYEITFKNRKIMLNGKLLHSPNFNTDPEVFFKYVFDNPNRAIDRMEIEKKAGRAISSKFSAIIRDLGFKGDIKKMFFPNVSNTAVHFINPITKSDFKERSLLALKDYDEKE